MIDLVAAGATCFLSSAAGAYAGMALVDWRKRRAFQRAIGVHLDRMREHPGRPYWTRHDPGPPPPAPEESPGPPGPPEEWL